MKLLLLLGILAAVALCGCSRRQETPTHTIFLIDVSGSIEPDSLKEAVRSIGEFISHVDRGDTVTIIPITSDALIESSGRILRISKPLARKAYDADIREFRESAANSLQEFETKLLASPGKKTDILNTLKLAEEETALESEGTKVNLKILSDFIEDDGEYDFKTDQKVGNELLAAELARSLAKSDGTTKFSTIYLGSLRSKDLHTLGRQRRAAIKRFWQEYLRYAGGRIRFATDGVGNLYR
ncbi:MAG: hypothetical protein JWO13_443 [Acidobacteriales bacterium]|nr:hypothetical protein [Terriglobales bacterium]